MCNKLIWCKSTKIIHTSANFTEKELHEVHITTFPPILKLPVTRTTNLLNQQTSNGLTTQLSLLQLTVIN